MENDQTGSQSCPVISVGASSVQSSGLTIKGNESVQFYY
jgi:hypothetical protein